MNRQNLNADICEMPPQAIEVEEAVIGALILESDSYEKVSGMLSSEMFYLPEHQLLYSIVADLHKNDKAVDLTTVTSYLKDTDKFNDIGGIKFLMGLTRTVASSAHIMHHSRIIAQKFVQRECIRVATEIQQKAYSNTDPEEITQIWSDFEDSFRAIIVGGDFGKPQREVLIETLIGLEKDNVERSNGNLKGIRTGFYQLDSIIGGFNPGQLIVLGARPGQGKTSLGLHFTKVAAMAGKRVLFFSMEMLKNDLEKILISSVSNIDRTKIRDAEITKADWIEINMATTILEKLPIYWLDNPNLNINQVQAIIKHHVKRNMVDLVIIDYLQLIRSLPGTKNNFREQEIAGMSRILKSITLSEQVPIICLCQLNRQAEGEAPKLHHLRESGSIEQDADIVLMPWKPSQYNQTDKAGQIIPDTLIEIIVAKNRNGKVGSVEIYDDGQMTSFSETQHILNRIVPEPNINAF